MAERMSWFQFEYRVQVLAAQRNVEREKAAGRLLTLVDYAKASDSFRQEDYDEIAANLIKELGYDPREEDTP